MIREIWRGGDLFTDLRSPIDPALHTLATKWSKKSTGACRGSVVELVKKPSAAYQPRNAPMARPTKGTTAVLFHTTTPSPPKESACTKAWQDFRRQQSFCNSRLMSVTNFQKTRTPVDDLATSVLGAQNATQRGIQGKASSWL